jgi:hypothetical protein
MKMHSDEQWARVPFVDHGRKKIPFEDDEPDMISSFKRAVGVCGIQRRRINYLTMLPKRSRTLSNTSVI